MTTMETGERFSQLPEFCFVFTPGAEPGQYVHAVRRGEEGYFATSYDDHDPDRAKALVQRLNERLGVSTLQAACMEAGAMFGFDIPAASPRLMRVAMGGRAPSGERRFLDDGMWFVEAAAEGERQTTNGYLFRRAVENVTRPGGAMCVGGYEQQADGKWTAEIAQEWDAETKTDSLRLGTFESRNDAIMALWEHRREVARERGTLTTDYEVAASWTQAVTHAEQKGEMAVGSMCEGREFCGRVLYADSLFVVQSTGRGAVVHATSALSRVPALGETAGVKYDAEGRAQVAERETAALER